MQSVSRLVPFDIQAITNFLQFRLTGLVVKHDVSLGGTSGSLDSWHVLYIGHRETFDSIAQSVAVTLCWNRGSCGVAIC
jgi:hypothetical protein